MTIYKILDTEIKVSTGIENAYFIKKVFLPYIQQSKDLFRNWYSSQYSCDRVWENLDAIMHKLTDLVTPKALEILQANGIYTIDYDLLSELFFNNCFDTLEDNAHEMMHKVIEIDGHKEDMADYRRARKAGRGRVVGGGFGFSGAVKGMATAGAMNAASGLAHSAANMVGNIGSSIAASANKSQLYSSYKDRLTEDAGDFVWDVMKEMRAILKKEKNMSFEFQSSESREKGNAIFNNFASGNIPEAREREMLAEALKLNYYNNEIYETIWIYFGDKTGDLVQMASYFDIPLEKYISKFVENYGTKMCEEHCPNFIHSKNRINASVTYEADIKKTISKIEAFCKDHDVAPSKCSTIKTLNDYLEIADKIKRTVEGVLYDTESEANEIKHDIEVFNDILDNKNIFDNDAFEAVSCGAYSSQKFKNELNTRFKCELVLRNPPDILESLYALTVKGNANEKTKSIFGILGKCGNLEETKVVFEQICLMQPQETALAIIDRSVGLFSNKGKGKSGVLFTNLNLRIFSKQLLSEENETFALTEIKDITALGGNDYLLTTTSGGSYKFEIHIGEMTIEEQNFLAELIYRSSQLIKHIYIDQRIQLGKILSPEGVKCICGKYVLKSEKICSNCHRFVDANGNFTDSSICPECGGYVKVNSRFCSKCGHQLIEVDNTVSEETTEEDVPSENISTEHIVNNEPTTIIICASCGKENNGTKKFCKYCGNKLEIADSPTTSNSAEAIICPNCGNSIKPGKSFCGKCGNKI